MALVGLNIQATCDYVSVNDPEYKEDGKHGKNATVFMLGTLDTYVKSRVQDKLTKYTPSDEGDPGVSVSIHEVAVETCRFAIKGWSGFMDVNGNEIKFTTKKIHIQGKEYQVVADDLMRRIPLDECMAMYRKIQDMNEVSKDEEGNSEGE